MVPKSFAALAGLLAAAAPAQAAPDLIDRHRWRSRLLVVVAPQESDPSLARQRQLFEAARAGMADRDLVFVSGVGRNADADALRRRFSVPPGRFRAILVGKDGGAKLSSDLPIPPATLFATVDAMPMRQGEMRRDRAAGAGR